MRLSFSSETIKITGNVKSLVKFEKKKFKLVVWDIATIIESDQMKLLDVNNVVDG